MRWYYPVGLCLLATTLYVSFVYRLSGGDPNPPQAELDRIQSQAFSGTLIYGGFLLLVLVAWWLRRRDRKATAA